MAAAKKLTKIADVEENLGSLEDLLSQLDDAGDGQEAAAILHSRGYMSREEIESTVSKLAQSLRKLKGENVEPEEKPEVNLEEKYPLVNVPDTMLTPDQVWGIVNFVSPVDSNPADFSSLLSAGWEEKTGVPENHLRRANAR